MGVFTSERETFILMCDYFVSILKLKLIEQNLNNLRQKKES